MTKGSIAAALVHAARRACQNNRIKSRMMGMGMPNSQSRIAPMSVSYRGSGFGWYRLQCNAGSARLASRCSTGSP